MVGEVESRLCFGKGGNTFKWGEKLDEICFGVDDLETHLLG